MSKRPNLAKFYNLLQALRRQLDDNKKPIHKISGNRIEVGRQMTRAAYLGKRFSVKETVRLTGLSPNTIRTHMKWWIDNGIKNAVAVVIHKLATCKKHALKSLNKQYKDAKCIITQGAQKLSAKGLKNSAPNRTQEYKPLCPQTDLSDFKMPALSYALAST